MSKFYTETPFDSWLIFDIEDKIKSISFSNQKLGYPIKGYIKESIVKVFNEKDLRFFDYSLLDTSKLSNKAKILHDFLIKTKTGDIFTYSEVAIKLFGEEKYRRAVATLLRLNKFAFFVPCHRVVSKNGLGGYSSGVELKIKILNWEKGVVNEA